MVLGPVLLLTRRPQTVRGPPGRPTHSAPGPVTGAPSAHPARRAWCALGSGQQPPSRARGSAGGARRTSGCIRRSTSWTSTRAGGTWCWCATATRCRAARSWPTCAGRCTAVRRTRCTWRCASCTTTSGAKQNPVAAARLRATTCPSSMSRAPPVMQNRLAVGERSRCLCGAWGRCPWKGSRRHPPGKVRPSVGAHPGARLVVRRPCGPSSRARPAPVCCLAGREAWWAAGRTCEPATGRHAKAELVQPLARPSLTLQSVRPLPWMNVDPSKTLTRQRNRTRLRLSRPFAGRTRRHCHPLPSGPGPARAPAVKPPRRCGAGGSSPRSGTTRLRCPRRACGRPRWTSGAWSCRAWTPCMMPAGT